MFSPRLIPRTGEAIDRRDLTQRDEIVERMARDVLAARRDGLIGLVDLTEHGWTLAQVCRWGPAAHDLAATPAFATQDVVERLRERETTTVAATVPGRPAPVGTISTPSTGDMTTMIDDLDGPTGGRAA